MADAFLTIELEGIDEDGGNVRFGEFIHELSAVRNALKRTQRLVLKTDTDAIEYKVVNLSHSSPARITVSISSTDPVYKDQPKRISRRFTYGLAAVRQNHRYARNIDTKTLEIFRDISAPTKKHVSRITVTGEGNRSVQIDKKFEHNVSRLLEVDQVERDEIVGRVERADIHGKNVFDIYPVLGSPKVRCTTPFSMREEVLTLLGKTISVDGWTQYRKDQDFPHAMKVIKIYPRQSDQDLPKMADLHGMAPDATDGLSGEDFIRKLRDAHW